MPFLSIITPFYNSEKKCLRLLEKLSLIDNRYVELIWVDDGSVDGTRDLLAGYKEKLHTEITIIAQENKGSGGARNTGLRAAKGTYVWFVDSDDDIEISVIDIFLHNVEKGYDFMDCNVINGGENVNTMDIPAGVYSDKTKIRKLLLKNMGFFWTKCIRRAFILENRLWYPEYSLFEDNALHFLYPFYVSSFLKVDDVGYTHHTDFDSMVRSAPSGKYFDRMVAMEYALYKGLELSNPEEHQILFERFIPIYLINTIGPFFTKPGKWDIPCRIMRQYRTVANKYGVNHSVFEFAHKRIPYRILFTFFWVMSHLFPDQKNYFDKIRFDTWGFLFDFKKHTPQ